MLMGPDDLIAITTREIKCRACPLAEMCMTNKMPATGEKEADILFVLDNPSETADKNGKAIADGVGKIFNRLWDKSGLGEKYTYRVTYAVKCHSKKYGVRVIRTCATEHLHKEIERHKPKIVVAMGNAALIALADKPVGINSVAGSLVESVKHPKVYAMINPGYLIYNEGAESRLVEDMRRIGRFIEGTVKKWKPKFEIAESPDEIEKFLWDLTKDNIPVAFDFETTSRNAFEKNSSIVCASLANNKRAMWIPFPAREDCPKKLRSQKVKPVEQKYWNFDVLPKLGNTVSVYDILFMFLANKKIPKIAHNAAFEMLWTRRYGYKLRGLYRDTMLMQYQLNPDGKGNMGLDNMTLGYLPDVGPYWKDMAKHNYDMLNCPLDVLQKYNASDAIVTNALVPILEKTLDKALRYDWRETHRFMTGTVTPMLARLSYNGWRTNKKRLERVETEFEKEKDELEDSIQSRNEIGKALRIVDKRRYKKLEKSLWAKEAERLAQDRMEKHPSKKETGQKKERFPPDSISRIQSQLEKFKPTEVFNVKSTIHKRALLYDVMNYKVVGLTQTGESSTNKKVLAKVLGDKDKQPKIIKDCFRVIEYRDMLSKYIRPMLNEFYTPDRYIHASYWQHKTGTGRLSSDNPNGQNLPERSDLSPRVKSPVVSRFGKDGVLLGVDYSQMEPRVLASICKDPGLTKALLEGDPYYPIAWKIFAEVGTAIASRKKCAKDLKAKGKKSIYRFMGKQLTLGIMYGKTPFGLAEELGISVEDAADIIEAFFKAFPGVRKYTRQRIKEVHKYGNVISRSPVHCRWFPDIFALEKLPRRNTKEMWKTARFKVAEAERGAVNTPIQGPASNITLAAAHECCKEISKQGLRCVLWNLVHDAPYFDCHKDDLPKLMKIVQSRMLNIRQISEWFKWLTCKLAIEIKQGKHWGQLGDN